MAEIKIVCKPGKLSQAAYESLCTILEATPRLPFGTFGKGVSVPASEGQPAIRAHLDRPAMLEFLLNGGWQSTV